MLQHEPTPEVLHQPFTSNYSPLLTAQEPEGTMPQELAQAIVAVEDRQGSSLQDETDSPVLRQAIEKSGLAITPDQLLSEVHRQRAQSHQNSAMTPHLTQNPSVRLLIAGLIFSSIVALFLLATNVLFISRFSTANEALAKYQLQANLKAAAPSALQRLQSWTYPGSTSFGSSRSTGLAIETLTTRDEYSKVWRFYAQQSGFAQSQAGRDSRLNGNDGMQPIGASGGVTQNGQTVQYDIQSNPTPNDQFATFTQSSPLHNVTAILMRHAGDPVTTVRLISSNPQ